MHDNFFPNFNFIIEILTFFSQSALKKIKSYSSDLLSLEPYLFLLWAAVILNLMIIKILWRA